jgi:hypothetical protein
MGISDFELSKLKLLCLAATSGPWFKSNRGSHDIVDIKGRTIASTWVMETSNSEANQKFIESSNPSMVMSLIEEITRLRAQ